MTTQTSRGDVLDCALSPDGRYLAYLAGRAGRVEPARAPGGDRQRRGGAAGAGRRPREPRRSRRTATTSSTWRASPTRRTTGRSSRCRRSAGRPRERAFDVDSRVTLLARRQAARVLAAACRRSRSPARRLRPRRARRSACSPRSRTPRSTRARPPGLPTARRSRRRCSSRRPTCRRRSPSSTRRAAARRDFLALPAHGPREPRLAARRPRARGERAGPAARPQRAGVPDRLSGARGCSGSPTTSTATPASRCRRGEEAIAAVRLTRLANLWLADAAGGDGAALTSITNPEDSPFDVAVGRARHRRLRRSARPGLQLWAIGAGGRRAAAAHLGERASRSTPGAAAGVVALRSPGRRRRPHLARGADGSGLRQLTSGKGEQVAAVSRDGRFAAFFPYDAPQSVSLLTVADGGVHGSSRAASPASLGFSPDSRS